MLVEADLASGKHPRLSPERRQYSYGEKSDCKVRPGGAADAGLRDHEKCYPPRNIPVNAQLTISGK
jgi:hypothetical protein